MATEEEPMQAAAGFQNARLPMASKDVVWQRVTSGMVKNTTGANSDVVTTVKQRKLKMFGHISCMEEEERILKITVEGMMEGTCCHGSWHRTKMLAKDCSASCWS